jgi:outer membrane protein assembly factor BamA
LRLGGGAAWTNPRIGSGEDPRFPSTDELFDPSAIPGFQAQPEYVRFGGTVSFDWRDEPLRPRAGGYYGVKVRNFKGQEFDTLDFRQYEADIQQYVHWLNRFRVLALRANVVISDADAGKDVPFFYMPTLGGGERLRGFREFRFRDRNSILMSAEYRWEAWWALEMALFVDAGKVAAERSDLDFDNLEASYGLGSGSTAPTRSRFDSTWPSVERDSSPC